MKMSLLPAARPRTSRVTGANFLPVQLSLLAVDVALIQLSLIGAFWLRIYTPLLGPIPNEHELGLDHAWTLVMVTGLLLYNYRSHGLYRAVLFSHRIQQSTYILKAVTVAMAFLLSVTFMLKAKTFVERRSIVVAAWFLLSSSEILVRCFLFPPLVQKFMTRRRAIIVGTGDCARQLLGRFSAEGTRDGVSVVGLLETGDGHVVDSVLNRPVLGTIDTLESLVESEDIQDIFIADLSLGPDRTVEIIRRCRELDVGIRVVSGLFEPIYSRVETEHLGTIPLVRLRRRPLLRMSSIVKRGMDILGAGIGLLLVSPLFVAIAILVKATSKGPVFFVQKRTGRDGRDFEFLKFRTMTTGQADDVHREYMARYINGHDVAQDCARTETKVNKIVNDRRITGIGRYLRRYSLDELPQLINILRGEMTLVGPRPPIPYEVEMYREWHKKRLDVTPGLTGLWQVSGRNRLSFEEMVLLDLYYVENWSIGLDLRILARTIPVVLFEKATY